MVFYWNFDPFDTRLLNVFSWAKGGASSSLSVFRRYFFFVLSTELLCWDIIMLFEKLW